MPKKFLDQLRFPNLSVGYKERKLRVMGSIVFLSILLNLGFSHYFSPRISASITTGSSDTLPAPSLVFVLEDSDPDYLHPPFEDRLTIISPTNHSKLKTISEFNIVEWIGARKALGAIEHGLACMVAEDLPVQISRYDFVGNRISMRIPLSIHSFDVSKDGSIYALTDGTTYGKSLLIIDQRGIATKEAPYGGIDIAVDDYHDSVWIVGTNITRLNRNLAKQFSIDPITWLAFSVDFASDGSAWVAELNHSGATGSQNRLLKISISGEILKTVELTATPSCLSLDRRDDSVWVATSSGLFKYDKNGNLTEQVETRRRWTVKVNQTDSSVWVAGYGDVNHYTKDGTLISAIPGFSSSQAYVAFYYRGYSSTSIELGSTSLDFGQTITATGSIVPARGNLDIKLLYSKPDGTSLVRIVNTMTTGSYTDTFKPDKAGSWNVKAVWDGDQDYMGSQSNVASFRVDKAQTTISIALSRNSVDEQDSIIVSGSMYPSLGQVSVTLVYTRPDGSTVSKSTTTLSDGSFIDTYIPDRSGEWNVKASWAGNENYLDAASAPAILSVKPTFPVLYLPLAILTIGIVGGFLIMRKKRPQGLLLPRSSQS